VTANLVRDRIGSKNVSSTPDKRRGLAIAPLRRDSKVGQSVAPRTTRGMAEYVHAGEAQGFTFEE
jgi:hypothetical protein